MNQVDPKRAMAMLDLELMLALPPPSLQAALLTPLMLLLKRLLARMLSLLLVARMLQLGGR